MHVCVESVVIFISVSHCIYMFGHFGFMGLKHACRLKNAHLKFKFLLLQVYVLACGLYRQGMVLFYLSSILVLLKDCFMHLL